MNNEDGPVPSTLTQPCFLGWSATDQNGNALMATTGVTFTSSNASVVAFMGPSDLVGLHHAPLVGTITPSQVFLQRSSLMPVGAGDAVVTVSARAARTVVPVHVHP